MIRKKAEGEEGMRSNSCILLSSGARHHCRRCCLRLHHHCHHFSSELFCLHLSCRVCALPDSKTIRVHLSIHPRGVKGFATPTPAHSHGVLQQPAAAYTDESAATPNPPQPSAASVGPPAVPKAAAPPLRHPHIQQPSPQTATTTAGNSTPATTTTTPTPATATRLRTLNPFSFTTIHHCAGSRQQALPDNKRYDR